MRSPLCKAPAQPLAHPALLLGFAYATLAACSTTTEPDLAHQLNHLAPEEQNIARAIASGAKKVCGLRQSNTQISQLQDIDNVQVQRLFKAQNGWYRASITASSASGEVYFAPSSGYFYCGKKTWLASPYARSANFTAI